MSNDNNESRRLSVYGLTALATTGAMALPKNAEAIPVIFSSGLTTHVSSSMAPDFGNDIFFDFVTGVATFTPTGSYDFSLKTFSSSITSAINAQFDFRKAAVQIGKSGNYWLGSFPRSGYPLRLGAGEAVGPRGKFASLSSTLATAFGSLGNWNAKGRGYIGFLFHDAQADSHFGWADITIHNDYTITLNRFGYEQEKDKIIMTPDAPEPNALELLLLGFPAIGAYRMKQKSRKKNEATLAA